jgi:ankyrin repeat protein
LKGVRGLLDAEPELIGKGDRRSNQPIHWATMTRQPDAIDELLERGADIDARRMDGARPIQVTNGDYFYRGWRDVSRDWPVTPAQVMAHLKARGAFVDLPTACHTGDIERVRELLRQDPSLANRLGEHEGYYLGAGAPLSNAAAVGRMDIVELLLDHGADPNLREEQYAPKGRPSTPPFTTATTRSRSCFSSAVRFRIRPSKARRRAVDRADIAARQTHGAAAAVVWGHARAQLAAHLAAARGRAQGDLAEAKRLLESGADSTARDDHIRSTPLAWAAKFGQLEMVEILRERGAPKSLPDDPPWATPLAWARKRGRARIAQLLDASGEEKK